MSVTGRGRLRAWATAHPVAARIARFEMWVLTAMSLMMIVLVTLIPALNSGSAVAITSGSMTPAISAGDLVVNRGIETAEVCGSIRAGDVITYNRPGDGLITHRVYAVEPGTNSVNECRIITQGDANTQVDSPISPAQVRGIMLYRLPLVGWVWQTLTPVVTFIVLLLIAGLTAAVGVLLGPRKPSVQWNPVDVFEQRVEQSPAVVPAGSAVSQAPTEPWPEVAAPGAVLEPQVRRFGPKLVLSRAARWFGDRRRGIMGAAMRKLESAPLQTEVLFDSASASPPTRTEATNTPTNAETKPDQPLIYEESQVNQEEQRRDVQLADEQTARTQADYSTELMSPVETDREVPEAISSDGTDALDVNDDGLMLVSNLAEPVRQDARAVEAGSVNTPSLLQGIEIDDEDDDVRNDQGFDMAENLGTVTPLFSAFQAGDLNSVDAPDGEHDSLYTDAFDTPEFAALREALDQLAYARSREADGIAQLNLGDFTFAEPDGGEIPDLGVADFNVAGPSVSDADHTEIGVAEDDISALFPGAAKLRELIGQRETLVAERERALVAREDFVISESERITQQSEQLGHRLRAVGAWETRLDEREAEIQALDASLANARSALEIEREVFAQKRAETESDLQVRQQRVHDAEVDLEARQQDLQRAREALGVQRAELEQAQRDLHERKMNLDMLRQDLAEHEQRQKARDFELQQETARVRAEAQKVAAQVRDIAAARSTVSEETTSLAAQREALAALQRELSRKSVALDEQRAGMSAREAQLREDSERLRAESLALAGQVNWLRDGEAKLQAKMAEMKKREQSMQTRSNSMFEGSGVQAVEAAYPTPRSSVDHLGKDIPGALTEVVGVPRYRRTV